MARSVRRGGGSKVGSIGEIGQEGCQENTVNLVQELAIVPPIALTSITLDTIENLGSQVSRFRAQRLAIVDFLVM